MIVSPLERPDKSAGPSREFGPTRGTREGGVSLASATPRRNPPPMSRTSVSVGFGSSDSERIARRFCVPAGFIPPLLQAYLAGLGNAFARDSGLGHFGAWDSGSIMRPT